MKEPGDWNKHAGRERDFRGFDEAGEFLEQQVSSLMAWCRGPAGQRCRIVLASNPPRGADGAWIIDWFAPWLDASHPLRAESGELRYAVMIEGKPVWQAGPDEVDIDDEKYDALSSRRKGGRPSVALSMSDSSIAPANVVDWQLPARRLASD